MNECSSCHTLNQDAERACLSCGAALFVPAPTGASLGMARCPAGHPIDPAWKSCPYCDRQPASATRMDGDAPPRSAARPEKTVLEPEIPRNGRTVFQEGQAAEKNGSIRRLLAVLAAPDLGAGGAIFPVRGGKNVIGSHRANDVALSGDTEVSSEHAVILHRNGAFHITDRLSTNGTWVNGQEIPANGTLPLRDRDRIRCGRTELVFLVIDSEVRNLD